ncbi:MAG TPA: hypothetical protein VLT34_09780 [Arthrobacter sp.]|nr:hypothetical protein [Arthrobacter sp.]
MHQHLHRSVPVVDEGIEVLLDEVSGTAAAVQAAALSVLFQFAADEPSRDIGEQLYAAQCVLVARVLGLVV